MAGVPDFSRREAAFRLYAEYKNLSKVSKELKIPTQTLNKWKKELKWEDKLALLRDKLRGQQEILDNAKDNFQVAQDLKEIALLELLEEEVADVLKTKRITIRSWRDVITTLEFTKKQRRLLQGEPTEIPKGEIDVTFTREEDLDKHIEELQRLVGDNGSTIK